MATLLRPTDLFPASPLSATPHTGANTSIQKTFFDLAKFIFCEILTAAFLFVFFVIIWWIQTLYLVFSLKISIRHRKKITIIFSWLSYYVVYILNSYAISDGYVVIFVRMAWLVHIVYFWSYFMLLLICTNLCKKQSGHCIVYI